MRPLYLEIEGVNSFLEKQEIDFAELSRNNLFCISGVTGSGKTTVLDCVLLGLYQRLPAFSSRGKIEDYINLRAEKAVIKFTFELEGTVYRTERVISRKAGANSVRLIDASTGVAVKEKADDAFAFLQEKLGLSVDEFARVIVLQQGQFAQFLKSTKADRNKMVINLFRLGRFEDIPSRFKRAEDKLKETVERLTEDLEEFEGITADSVKDAERTYKNALKNVDSSFKARENARVKLLAVKEGEEKYGLYEQALKNKEALLLKKAELDEQKQAIDGQKAELDGKIEKLKEDKKQKESKIAVLAVLKNDAERLKEINAKEKELTAMRREYDEARQDCAVKAEKLNEILGQTVALEQALKEFGLDYGLEQAGLIKGELIAKKSAYDADIKELVKSENLLKEYLSEFQQKTEKKNALALNLENATKRLQSAEDELSKAKLKHSAEHLKSTVNEGDVCPVCGQIVEKISLDGAVDFAPLNAEVEKAKEEESRVKSEYETLMLEFTRLSTLIANEEKNRDSIAIKTADVKPDELSETLIKLDGYLDALKKYEDLSKRKVTAEADKTRADGKLEEVAKRGKQARESLDESKKSLSETDPDKLVEAIKQTEAFINGVTEFEKSCDEQNRHLTLAQTTNGEALARVGAELGAIEESVKEIPAKPTVSLEVVAMETQTLERTYDEALSASAKAEKDKELIIASYEKKKVLSKKRQDARARYEKMHDVSSAMARGEFIAYVATEYIKDFTVTASATLSELTGGKYSLEYDEKEGEFLVTDFLSNNEKRKAKTLSGGETFLASLAMAIALSQEIARYGNFDFFFIDEGFGTLHEQALDQALEVLRRLSETSLVGLVTHRTELKEKIPVTLLVTPAEDERGSRCKIV